MKKDTKTYAFIDSQNLNDKKDWHSRSVETLG